MQQQQEESEDAYLQWVEAARGNVSLAARQHATTPNDIEPLRKRIQGAVNRSKAGAAPVPVDQRKKRKGCLSWAGPCSKAKHLFFGQIQIVNVQTGFCTNKNATNT